MSWAWEIGLPALGSESGGSIGMGSSGDGLSSALSRETSASLNGGWRALYSLMAPTVRGVCVSNTIVAPTSHTRQYSKVEADA